MIRFYLIAGFFAVWGLTVMLFRAGLRRHMRKLMVALACLGVNAFGLDLYVDQVSGNDANSGDLTHPFKTIPGTQKVDATGYLNTTWGPYTTAGNIPDGTVIHVKAGTTHTVADGGYILIADFYNRNASRIAIQCDTSYGSGAPAVFDFALTTNSHLGAFTVQGASGLVFSNLTILNAPWDAIYNKEYGGGQIVPNFFVLNCRITNSGAQFDPSNLNQLSSEGAINFRTVTNGAVYNCIIDNKMNPINGLMFGDTQNGKTNVYCFVGGNIIVNSLGDPNTNDDVGIGIKAIQSTLVITNNFCANNQKGMDLGSHASGQNFGYTVANNVVSNNYGWGMNFVGQGNSSSGPNPGVSYPFVELSYAVNNLIISNGVAGLRSYGSCQTLSIVGNYFNGNGWTTGPFNGEGTQINLNPDDHDGTGPLVYHVYNNIFVGALGLWVYVDRVNDWKTNIFTLDMNYNAYIQKGTERFAAWDLYGQGNVVTNYSFGVNGPGHPSGGWYTSYQTNGVNLQSRGGVGHFGNDANSYATGGNNSTPPPYNYTTLTITSHYPGLNLSAQPWFVAPLMSLDRNGNQRVTWDVGPFEFNGAPPGQRIARITNLHAGTTVVGP